MQGIRFCLASDRRNPTVDSSITGAKKRMIALRWPLWVLRAHVSNKGDKNNHRQSQR